LTESKPVFSHSSFSLYPFLPRSPSPTTVLLIAHVLFRRILFCFLRNLVTRLACNFSNVYESRFDPK
jgi:hypothetical protein